MRFFLFILFTVSAAAQSVGDFSINYKANSTGPQSLKSWAKANSTLWGTNSSGNPQSITIGSGLSLTSGVLAATGSGGTWGTITGTLSEQTDLQTALNAKQAQSSNLDTLSAGLGASIGQRVVAWDGSTYALLSGALSVAYGGTGISSYAVGDMLFYGASSMQKLAGNTTTTKKFLTQTGTGSASADPAWGTIQGSDITFTDVTTGNATTSNHGYLRKLDGNASHYLDGTGAWSTPSGGGGGLTIGTSTITSGTSGYILYNNAGVLGQLATTGSGSVVRDTSPTMSDATITGKIYMAGSNNYIWRNGSGHTEITTATNSVSMVTFIGEPIMTASTSGLTLPGLVVDLAGVSSYPGSYPSLPAWENFARGRSYRPGTNVTAFAHQIIAPGDIYDGTGITITDAATLYIHGEPFAHPAGAAIAGNKWALWVGHGASRFDGPVVLGSGGTKHTSIKSGVATLVAGTVTVSDSDVLETGTASTSSRILVTRMNDGGTVGTGYSITRVNGTSFTITTVATETSTLSWLMVNP